jgi:hypothetical protein
MTELVVDGHVEKLDQEYTQQLIQKLSEGKSWWRAIAENFIGSVVVALVWALIVVVVAASKVGPDRVIGDVFDKNITDRQSGNVLAQPPPASAAVR